MLALGPALLALGPILLNPALLARAVMPEAPPAAGAYTRSQLSST